jgi:hypothetical protein
MDFLDFMFFLQAGSALAFYQQTSTCCVALIGRDDSEPPPDLTVRFDDQVWRSSLAVQRVVLDAPAGIISATILVV